MFWFTIDKRGGVHQAWGALVRACFVAVGCGVGDGSSTTPVPEARCAVVSQEPGHAGTATVQEKEFSEYQLKAAYLVKFLRYVDWAIRKEGDDQPFVIGILGKSPFGKIFEAVDGKVVEGTKRKLVIRTFETRPSDADLHACHILFVCSSERDNIASVIEALHGHPVLAVTEGEGMTEHGVAFGLVMEKRQVRFECNAEVAEAVNLKISAQLQRLALRRKS